MARTRVETNIYYDYIKKLFYVNMDYGKELKFLTFNNKRMDFDIAFRLCLLLFGIEVWNEICYHKNNKREKIRVWLQKSFQSGVSTKRMTASCGYPRILSSELLNCSASFYMDI